MQNRFGRLTRTILPTLALLQKLLDLDECLVADGLENFCVSQDFPNNFHILVGKDSQVNYGFNYTLMRRKGKETPERRERCELSLHSHHINLLSFGFSSLRRGRSGLCNKKRNEVSQGQLLIFPLIKDSNRVV